VIRKRLLADITPLRESAAFRRLWAGTTLSSVGGALTAFAVVLQVYDLTRSPFAVGLIGVAQMVPTLAAGLLGGPVTDALDRRKLVLVTSTCLAGVSAALAAQAFAGLDLVWPLYALVAARLPPMPPQGGGARLSPRAVAEGVAFIRRSQVIAGAFLTDLNATVFGLPAALFPAINAERFGGDPRTLGLFTTAIGIGGLASAAFSGPVGHVSRQGRAMLAAVAVWGAAFAGFAVAPGLWLTLGLLAVAGTADTFTVVFRGAIVTALAPDQLRGRVMAADYVIGAGGGQLGNLEAGALGSLTSPTISALAGGLVTIAGAAVIALAMPAFTRYRREPVPPAAPAAPVSADAGGEA
jgi:MFS family permease